MKKAIGGIKSVWIEWSDTDFPGFVYTDPDPEEDSEGRLAREKLEEALERARQAGLSDDDIETLRGR